MSALVKHGLDWCIYALDQMRADGTWLPSTERWIEETAAARAELAALRKRVEDLDLILRGIVNGRLYRLSRWPEEAARIAWSKARFPDLHPPYVLTNEARKALGGDE